MGLRGWEIQWGRPSNVHGAWYMSPTTRYADRIVVDDENVCGAVVESLTLLEIEVH